MRKLSVRVTCPKFHCWGWRGPDSAQVKLTPQPEPLPRYSTQWSPGPHSRETPLEELRWRGGSHRGNHCFFCPWASCSFLSMWGEGNDPNECLLLLSSTPRDTPHLVHWDTLTSNFVYHVTIIWENEVDNWFFQFLSGRREFYHLTTNTPQIPFWNV